MSEPKVFVVRRHDHGGILPDNSFSPVRRDTGVSYATAIVVPVWLDSEELEVTIRTRKSKRERRQEAMRAYLPASALHDRELVRTFLDALEALDREDP